MTESQLKTASQGASFEKCLALLAYRNYISTSYSDLPIKQDGANGTIELEERIKPPRHLLQSQSSEAGTAAEDSTTEHRPGAQHCLLTIVSSPAMMSFPVPVRVIFPLSTDYEGSCPPSFLPTVDLNRVKGKRTRERI